MELQQALLDETNANEPITEDYITKFSMVIEDHWLVLASLLSFTTAEIEEIKRGVTGVPSVKAAAMMNKWRIRSRPTYGVLKSKVIIPYICVS